MEEISMNGQRLFLFLVISMITVFTLTSCADVAFRHPVSAKPAYGPPPHAPAHGYRHKHHNGPELVFDSGLGVYVVADLNDYFYFENYYYRLLNDHWEISLHVRGPWKPAAMAALPPGLQKKNKCKGQCKKNSYKKHGSKKKFK